MHFYWPNYFLIYYLFVQKSPLNFPSSNLWNKFEQLVTHYTSDIVSSGHLYIINLNDKDAEQRNKFIEKMAGLGVATNVHYKPLPMHTGYKKLGFKIEDYPNAYKQFKNVVTLPLHTCLSDEDVDYVIECVKECLK